MTLALALVIGASLPGSTAALAAGEDAERATTLVRMLRFVALPSATSAGDLMIAVVDNQALAAALRDAAATHRPGGRSITVVHVASVRALADVDAAVVVLGVEAAPLARQLSEQGILTVGDGEWSDANGGLVLSLAADGDRHRFSANPSAAARAGVTLSSRLLRLAQIAN